MADDDSIDIASGCYYRLAGTTVTSDMFHNLMDMPEIDFSADWWIGDLVSHATLGNKIFIAAGNLDPGFYDKIYTLVFNKELAASLKVDDFYKQMRAYDLDFGIIPYPKWDEKQDTYYTNVAIGNVAGYVVPITTDKKLAGCILESMAYYGWTDVYPEYYDYRHLCPHS